jgi:hypothetical protein
MANIKRKFYVSVEHKDKSTDAFCIEAKAASAFWNELIHKQIKLAPGTIFTVSVELP